MSRHRLSGALGIVAVVIVLAGCGSSSSSSSKSGTASTSTASTNTSTSSSAAAPSGWPLPNANLAQTRDVGGPINASTVSELGKAWSVPILAKGAFGSYFTSPVVVDGIAYTQDEESNVYAINMETGKVLWTKKYDVPDTGPNGVTVDEGTVYGATQESAFALSAATGEQLWEKKLIRNKNEGIDMAPGYNNGTVYVSTVPGNTKAFYAGDGQAILWAMDAKTGATKWKWEEVPASLWGNPKINSGGGQWEPPTFDREGNLYLGVANPAPFPGTEKYPWGSSRPGPNLYTDSVVKLNAQTGKLMWYYQLTPHDINDWDVNNAPVLTTSEGKPIVIDAGKAGIAFALDAETGKLLWKTPVGEHNGHDEDHLHAMNKEYSKLSQLHSKEYKVLPGILGGVESPLASNGKLAFFPINNFPATFITKTQSDGSLGNFEAATGAMVAIEQSTGKIVWEHKLPHSAFGAATVVNDLVFTTTFDGTVWALNAETGEAVWHASLPAGTNSPISVIGNTVLAAGSFVLGKGQKAEIVAFRLGAKGSAESTAATTETKSTASTTTKATETKSSGATIPVAAGIKVFSQICSTCHTLAAAKSHGTVGPNLDQLKPSFALVVHQVTNGGGGMPAFGTQLSKSQIESVAEFVSSVAGKDGSSKTEEGAGAGAP